MSSVHAASSQGRYVPLFPPFTECRAISVTIANAAQSTSSFECDGCTHHASFHSMENKEEDAIRKRWEQEARDKALREQQELEDRPRKKPRAIEYGRGGLIGSRTQGVEGGMVTPDEETASEVGSARVAIKAKAKGSRKATTSTSKRGSRAGGRITEILEGDEDYIEVN